MITRFALCAAILAFGTPAAAAPAATRALPAPVIVRIPDSAARPAPPPADPNAALVRGEFATAVRTMADRRALRAAIEQQRTAEAARFASGAGPAIAVRLRRSKY